MKITELRNVTLGLERIPAGVGREERFSLSFADKTTGDVIWISFNREVADQIIAKLTSGVHVARAVPGSQ